MFVIIGQISPYLRGVWHVRS